MKKDILLKSIFIILSIVTIQKSAIACACCLDGLFFCNSINEDLYIVRAVVNSNPTVGIIETMEITILDNIHQEVSQDTILVTGGNSMMTCGQSLKIFSPQDTLILALSHNPKVRKDYWFLTTGKYYLPYENGMVSGQISHSVTRQTLQKFKENLFSCIREVPMYNFKDEQNLSLFPSTTDKGLELSTEDCLITGYYLYDSNQKRIAFKTFNPTVKNIEVNLKVFGGKLDFLKEGMPFLRVTTDKGEITWRFAWTND